MRDHAPIYEITTNLFLKFSAVFKIQCKWYSYNYGIESFHGKHATKKAQKDNIWQRDHYQDNRNWNKWLNIHVFTPSNCICSHFPLFFRLLLPLLPALIGTIISEQFMPTDWARIVLILPKRNVQERESQILNKSNGKWKHKRGSEFLL